MNIVETKATPRLRMRDGTWRWGYLLAGATACVNGWYVTRSWVRATVDQLNRGRS